MTTDRTILTAATVTDSQIETLASEAAGIDAAQVELCQAALAGDERARERCAEAIQVAIDAAR